MIENNGATTYGAGECAVVCTGTCGIGCAIACVSSIGLGSAVAISAATGGAVFGAIAGSGGL